jgi:hypothetical protein
LSALRRAHPALRRGTLEIIDRSSDGIAFVRTLDSDRVLVVIDRSPRPRALNLVLETSEPVTLWGGGDVVRDGSNLTVTPTSGAIIIDL